MKNYSKPIQYFIMLVFIFLLLNFFDFYLFDTYLCDGSFLSQLKLNLTYETSVYRHNHVTYEYLVDLKNQMENLPSDLRNLEDEEYMVNKANSKLIEMNESLNRVRTIENNIRRLEPNFQSPIRAIRYPRIGG
jgi:hypothetical protein